MKRGTFPQSKKKKYNRQNELTINPFSSGTIFAKIFVKKQFKKEKQVVLTRNEQHHANASSMGSQDIVNLILDDHKSLKNLIRIMKDGTQPAEIRFLAFKEFVPKLIAHAKPEEQTLYLFMKAIGSVREDGFAGNLKKSIADQLVEEIKKTTDLGLRIACIKVLAEYVEHRIEEEEKDLLPDFVYYSKPSDRQNLGNSFLNKKKINLRKVMAAARADSL